MVLLDFLFIFVFDEGALFGLSSFFRASSIVAVFFISSLIIDANISFINTIFSKQWLTSFDGWTMPDIIWPLFILVGTYLLTRQDKSIFPYTVTLVLSFLTLMLAFNKTILIAFQSFDLRFYNAWAFSIIGFLSLYSVYKLYWQNVYIDDLTTIPNRRAFNEQLKKLGRTYTIAMIDIDNFKKFNDTHGHTEGDNALRYVATHLQEVSKSRVFRYGGEEFVVIYSGYKLNDVQWRLEKMRESLAERRFHIRMNEGKRLKSSEKDRGKSTNGSKKVKITISVGMAQRSDKFKIPQDVIEAADKALYAAKKKGRNQCAIKRG
jgi:diguanylate cyclase (GGDEF)-like protein